MRRRRLSIDGEETAEAEEAAPATASIALAFSDDIKGKEGC
jgi:hypothetical protein